MLRLLEWAVIVLIAALVLDVLWQVTTRFVLKDPSKWTVELACYSMAWLSMLGTAVAFAHREHLGLDYFKLKLHGDAQRVASILSQLVVIAFAGWVMLGGGVRLVSEVLATGQSSAALGIPMGAGLSGDSDCWWLCGAVCSGRFDRGDRYAGGGNSRYFTSLIFIPF